MTTENIKKAPNFVVLSTKGGVGKSVISLEVVAPYLLKMGYAPEVRLLNDYNHDESDYENTDLNIVRVNVGSEKDLANNMHNAIEFGDEAVVIDVGGNKTCKVFVSALALNENHLDDIDLFIIPINDNAGAVKNAIDTIKLFEAEPLLKNAASKIVIAINQTAFNSKESDLRKRYYNVFSDLIDVYNLKWFSINNMDGLDNFTQIFGLTSYEVHTHTNELKESTLDELQDLTTRIRANELDAADGLLKLASIRRKRIELKKNTPQSYYVSIDSAFKQLDEILKK